MPESKEKINIDDHMRSATRAAIASIFESLPLEIPLSEVGEHTEGDITIDVVEYITVGDVDLDCLRDYRTTKKKKPGRPRKKKAAKKKAAKRKSSKRNSRRAPTNKAESDESESAEDDTEIPEGSESAIVEALGNSDSPLSCAQIAEVTELEESDVSKIVMNLLDKGKAFATKVRGKMRYALK